MSDKILIIVAIRTSGNISCVQPCVVEENVPTTSFAVLLKTDSSDRTDAELSNLTSKLFK